MTPVPLAGMVRVAWVGSLVASWRRTKSSPVAVGANVTLNSWVAPGATETGRAGVDPNVNGPGPTTLLAVMSSAASPVL